MERKKQKSRAMKRALEVVRVKQKDDGIKSDVQGSYTGTPLDKNEKPVQDADDL